MPFDWMQPHVSAAVLARNPQRRLESTAHDLRARAALLQRLGYAQDYAVQRCFGNLKWGYELSGAPPFNHDEVKALVADVYAKKPGA